MDIGTLPRPATAHGARLPVIRWAAAALLCCVALGGWVSDGLAADPSRSADASEAPALPPGPPPSCTPEVEPNDLPEQAPVLSSAICLTGTLPELRDQDLVLWDVEPAEALITWRITVTGIPTTITSVHLFRINGDPTVFPIDAREFLRVDSSATSDVPGVQGGVSLAAGRYLLGVSRGDPAKGPPAPAGEYQVTIEREQGLPPDGDAEPNDDPATATPVRSPIALVGDAQGSVDLFRWTVDAHDATARQQLDVRGVAGTSLGIELLDGTGAQLERVELSRTGDAHLYDLALPAGDYLIQITAGGSGSTPYVLTSQTSTDPLADAEPNGDAAHALPLAVGSSVSGRLAGPRDVDDYALQVPQTIAANLMDIRLDVGSGVSRLLCVRSTGGVQVQCTQGTDPLVLANLLLAAGDYVIEVSGTEDLADHYRLSVTDTGPAGADREVEPNDTTATASAFHPDIPIHGHSSDGDPDFYRITVTGPPQVWRLDATGTGIRQLQWLEPDLELLGTADVSPDGTQASLWDMYLIPGDHWLSMLATGGDYTLSLLPLGPLGAGFEHEPNDTSQQAEALSLDELRTGRLPGAADTDVYRFSLEAEQHVVVDLEPPADAAVSLRLVSGTGDLMRVRDPAVGQPLVYDAVLPTGDYELWLSSSSRTIQPYTIVVRRGDAFQLPTDLEPDDSIATARDVPSDLVIQGSGWGRSGEDDDWFRLAAPSEPSVPIVVTTHGPVTRVEMTDGTTGVTMDPDATRTVWTSRQLPGGVPLYLHLTTGGDYEAIITGGGLTPTPVPGVPSVGLALHPDTVSVSAYETFGQRVVGALTLRDTSGSGAEVTLDARTSDDRWSITLSAANATIPASGTTSVPFQVDVPADAWADVPTRVTVEARTADGRMTTASVDITPARDASPVGAGQVWPLPEPLLGGLDAASLALGATVVPFGNPAPEQQLHDGYALAGTGYQGSIGGQPLAFTVDLATDTPVPVRGLIVDPLAGTPTLFASPRHFELALSDDGAAWTTVLAGALTPRQADQSFVLDAPVPARFAQLRFLDTWGGDHGSIQVGEWQVIADPGWAPTTALDIADPTFGGHVVIADPAPSDPRQVSGMLDEAQEGNPWRPLLQAHGRMSWVVGFLDGRAAQITQLQWVDPPASDPTSRFTRVDVQVSTGTPLGPWTDVGTWELARAADASVTPFAVPAGTWARYVRFVGDGPTDTRRAWEVPQTLRILERATDDTYRSIIGAWGRDQGQAIMELLTPPDLSGVAHRDVVADGNDSPATATPLVLDVPQEGVVKRGVDTDWYGVTVPATDNLLTIALAAPAAAGLEVSLQDAAGADVPMTETTSSEPAVTRYVADVIPGASYRVHLQQPPFSTVFTYDTSGSMGSYLAYVFGALRSFAADIVPGEEAVQVMPFEEQPLLDHWSDDPYQIESAVESIFSARGSSAAEASLLGAMQQLQDRPGAKAILLVTDAETMSYGQIGALWSTFATVKPIVFSVHVGGGGDPQLTTQLMHDWADSWGGHYAYAVSHGQIDRAFDRLATWLRRPADYTLTVGSVFVDHSPGKLRVTPPDGPGGGAAVVAGSGVGVEILFDTSGSMRKKIAGQSRVQIAKRVLGDLVGSTLPKGLPVALRVFTPGKGCGTQLLTPLGPLDRDRMRGVIEGLTVRGETRTPLAGILGQVAGDLQGASGTKLVVLVTDGQETCKGDPEQAIKDLVAQGIDVHLNIVGFAIDDPKLKQRFQRWATEGNGHAFDAQSEAGLVAGVTSALAAPFEVHDQDGAIVARGIVGGDPVELPPGTYRVEVLTEPRIMVDDVVVRAGGSKDVQLQVPSAP